jgi:hypothetical protein
VATIVDVQLLCAKAPVQWYVLLLSEILMLTHKPLLYSVLEVVTELEASCAGDVP